VHRLPAADDRAAVGATMNLTEDQPGYLVTLTPGEAAVHADGMDYPVLARMPGGTDGEIGTVAPVASPASLITPRSSTCGAQCRAVPCTLRQVRAAQRAAVADPRITLWAELSVLTQTEPRLRDCALSHAVDAAVAARIPVISARVSGPALAPPYR